MPTPESIIEAFGRGLMQGAMMVQQGKEKKERPVVVKTQDVERAVANHIQGLLNQEPAPSGPQLDMFTQDIEQAEPDELTRMTMQKVREAQERSERNGQTEMPEGVFDPNLGGTPWSSPLQQ